jgi:3',5'-cyclic-AMP phosphodiesterase
MPLHIAAGRRRFLASTLAAAAALSIPRLSQSGEAAGMPRSFALLADTHIAADKGAVLRDVRMAEHLERVWKEVRAAEPAAALVHGDVAVLKGEAGDYRTLAELIVPGGQTDVPLHFLLGNHDDRVAFREVLRQAKTSPLDSHHVALLDAGPANWLLLDSLDQVNVTPGLLGEGQLAWIAQTLDAQPGKPALISVHHNPYWPPQGAGARHGALLDTQALFAILQPRKQVKAVFFGHTHHWSVTEREGLHLVNLPPVAYVFAAGRPSGWVSAELADRGITLTLHALDRQHAQHGERHELAWR